jgi:hypothetical protein
MGREESRWRVGESRSARIGKVHDGRQGDGAQTLAVPGVRLESLEIDSLERQLREVHRVTVFRVTSNQRCTRNYGGGSVDVRRARVARGDVQHVTSSDVLPGATSARSVAGRPGPWSAVQIANLTAPVCRSDRAPQEGLWVWGTAREHACSALFMCSGRLLPLFHHS